MKYANWNVPERGAEIPRALLAAGCTPLLAAILHLRGLSDPAAARSFLRGGAETLTNPLELTGMVDAVQRLTRAVATGEHVAVYGDYDVDGITAACLLTDYLRFRGLTCELYIPDRIRDGYGLNTAAIDALAEKGVTLIVTVDCGVTNLEETAYAAQRGVDMIVTDHHECREALPEAEAVVDPKQPDSSGVGTALAGVGVAFKLVCAMDGDADKMLARYGDLVAVGTVADVMPLLGENRFITRCGLQKIAAGDCRPGFLALAEEAGVRDKPFTASTVGFSLAPRINAAGRLGEPSLAVRLLEETDLLSLFYRVNEYLDPDGIFIFDLNTVYKYRELLGETTIAENREEGSFIWDNYFDEEEQINEYDLTFFIREEEGLYRRFEETHYQRAYELETVKHLLEQAGLEFVAAYDAFTREPVKEDSERIYVIARSNQET